MKLSIALITYNEAHIVEKTLQEVSKIADEIIVVDNGSNDGTIEILKKFNAKVFIEDWKGFGKQKQSCIAKCSGEWILFIDADEVLTEESVLTIKNAIEKPSADVYRIKRINYCFGKQIKYCYKPDYIERLFKKSIANYSDNNVHETLVYHHNVKVKDLNPCYIQHYTKDNIEEMIKKLNLYTSEGAKDKFNKKKSVNYIILIIKPLVAFVKMFIINLGFLDGSVGLMLSVYHSFYTFSQYSKLYLLKSQNVNLKQ